MGGRRTHEGEDVGGDDEDDEEREEVDEPGAERGHGGGGGVARHGDAAGEGERAEVAEEGREGSAAWSPEPISVVVRSTSSRVTLAHSLSVSGFLAAWTGLRG